MVAVVINREDRPERLKASQEQFNKYGMDVQVFPALIGGWRGCRDSHLAVMYENYHEKQILILEDDVLFLYDPMEGLTNAAKELPENWDVLYLGISPTQRLVKHSPHLYKVNGGYTTHAILWNNKPDGVVKYIMDHYKDIAKWDVYLSSVIHKQFNCFVLYPLLATQRQEKSDTCHRSDASSIIRNYNKFVI